MIELATSASRFGGVSVVAAALLFAAAVVVCSNEASFVDAAGEGGDYYDRTTLERVMTRAFNAKTADGTWQSIFGGYGSDLRPQSFCTGAYEQWPSYPTSAASDSSNETSANVAGTDLERVVGTNGGVFRCGYLQSTEYHMFYNEETDENVDLIRTPGPPGEDDDPQQVDADGGFVGSATGLIADFWNEMAAFNNMTVQWKLYPSSQATLTALNNGNIDAACGKYVKTTSTVLYRIVVSVICIPPLLLSSF